MAVAGMSDRAMQSLVETVLTDVSVAVKHGAGTQKTEVVDCLNNRYAAFDRCIVY